MSETPKCHRCGVTIPKPRRDVSDFCTKRCAVAQHREDEASAKSEREEQEDLASTSRPRMSDEQVKHMVDRFLGWRLPEGFQPDAGINFEPHFNVNTPHPMKHQPIGTNLFTASQAESMVRYMVDGMPSAALLPQSAVDVAR